MLIRSDTQTLNIRGFPLEKCINDSFNVTKRLLRIRLKSESRRYNEVVPTADREAIHTLKLLISSRKDEILNIHIG